MKYKYKISLLLFFQLSLISPIIYSSSLYDTLSYGLIINKEIIDAFKTIWNTENYPLVYDEYINSDTILDGNEMDIIRSTLNNYYNNTDIENDTLGFMDLLNRHIIEYKEGPKLVNQDISIKEKAPELQDNVPFDTIIIKEKSDISNSKILQIEEIIKPDNTSKKSKSNKLNEEKKLKNTADIINKNKYSISVAFSTQVAASLELFDMETIRKIYNGNFPVFICYEDGWYKYIIGKTLDYSEACKIKQHSNVKDAFIVAYKNNKRLALEEFQNYIAEPINKRTEKYKFYKIQIAASKSLLDNDILNELYSGNEPIDIVIEDNWYKYQVGTFNTINEAQVENQNCHNNDAFLVTYCNGQNEKNFKNFKFQGIIKNNDKLSANDTIIFRILVDSSEKAITDYEIVKLYKNYKKINIFYEDGFFKYYIGDYKNLFDAVQAKNSMHNKYVKIVAFKNNNKINLYEALNYKK